jgi:uncharacterized glyoxalase superfamily protein PhnB
MGEGSRQAIASSLIAMALSVRLSALRVPTGFMTNPPTGYTRVCPYLLYEDAERAIAYLAEAFGFEKRRTEIGGAGRMHAELVVGGDGLVMLGQAGEGFESPKRLGKYPPSLVHVYVDAVEALHRRATDAQADVSELEISPSRERRFTATDPEGQVWVFAQRVDP